jgi:hypothetical protein
VKQEGVKQEGVKQEGVKQEGVKQEGVKQEGVKQEGVKKDLLATVNNTKTEELKTLLPKKLFGISPTKLGIGLVVVVTTVGAVTYGIHSCRSNTKGGNPTDQNPPSNTPDAN